MTNKDAAYIITGPTSGYGLATARELAKSGTVVLVGRSRAKLDALKASLGSHAIAVVCDLSDVASAKRAAEEIIAMKLPIAGVLNNAGIREAVPTKSKQGWDNSFATNHLGPFVFTETLLPYLRDGARVAFVVSAVEEPERKPAKAAGFRGGRWISAEASARGEWSPEARRTQASIRTRPRSRPVSPRPSSSRKRIRGCAFTPSNPASIPAPVSAVRRRGSRE